MSKCTYDRITVNYGECVWDANMWVERLSQGHIVKGRKSNTPLPTCMVRLPAMAHGAPGHWATGSNAGAKLVIPSRIQFASANFHVSNDLACNFVLQISLFKGCVMLKSHVRIKKKCYQLVLLNSYNKTVRLTTLSNVKGSLHALALSMYTYSVQIWYPVHDVVTEELSIHYNT